MDALSNALGSEGIFVAQVGETDSFDDAPETLYPDHDFSSFLRHLQQAGFESISDFDEAHGRLGAQWSFLIAKKDHESRAKWFKNEAELQREMHNRLLTAKDGESPLRFFDGASMMQYQFPSRVVETIWCRGHPEECESGHGYDPELSFVPVTAFEVKPSAIANGGRGVFTKEFIPKGSIIALDKCVHSMYASSGTSTVLDESHENFEADFFEVLYSLYLEGYGWSGNEHVSECSLARYFT